MLVWKRSPFCVGKDNLPKFVFQTSLPAQSGFFMENKLIPNTTQIPHFILREWLPKLSDTELRVILIIADQTFGWHKASDYLSYSQLVKRTGNSNGAIGNALRSLREKGFIKVLDEKGRQLFSKEECSGKKLFYSINADAPDLNETSPENGEVDPNLSRKWNPKNGDTKETNTKTLPNGNEGVVKKQPSCPLLNGSPLKEKYPNGHHECTEYILDEEKHRAKKFINLPKQYNALHKILRAGYGFDKMEITRARVEKKYGPHAWDFATLATWLEKGAANGEAG